MTAIEEWIGEEDPSGTVVPTILVFLHAQWKAWVRHNAWRRHAKRGHHQSIR